MVEETIVGRTNLNVVEETIDGGTNLNVVEETIVGGTNLNVVEETIVGGTNLNVVEETIDADFFLIFLVYAGWSSFVSSTTFKSFLVIINSSPPPRLNYF